jgi:hypothetical protein
MLLEDVAELSMTLSIELDDAAAISELLDD